MNQNQTIEQILRYGKSFLKTHSVPQSALDAELLLMNVLSVDRIYLFSHSEKAIGPEEQRAYEVLLQKRAKGIPLQYLTGVQEFMGMPFEVNAHVLIPRADTEVLVETVLWYISKEDMRVFLDIGTGTGCIPISIVRYEPQTRFIAIDISKEALSIARKNAEENGVQDRVGWLHSDVFTQLPREVEGQIDGIVSNPPYIPTGDIKDLMREVKEHEPNLALDGGEDGLRFYRNIIQKGKIYLRPGGRIFFEIGYNQASQVSRLFEQEGYRDIQIKKDLAGLDRVVFARK